MKFLMIGARVSQFVSSHLGSGGFWVRLGEARIIAIGMWSEPVAGREDSQLLTMSSRRGFVNAKSMTEGWALPARVNLVDSLRVLRRANPASAAFAK